MTRRVLFLPGAGGAAAFWSPVARRLPDAWDKRRLNWPGLGAEPHDPDVNGMDDLVARVLAEMDGPVDLVSQSMGGLVAIKVALAAPERVRRLVLAATSGGVHVAGLGGADWRADYRRLFPEAAPWITQAREDLSDRLGEVSAPVLLLFGDADTIAPPAVGERLLMLLPDAALHVIPGGDHDLAFDRADEAAPLIERHLA